MPAERHRTVVRLFALLAAATLADAAPALASRPVPKTVVGCVLDGRFVSSNGYEIHPRDARGGKIDLRPFEGHTVTMSGNLLPGDAFIINNPPRDSGPCTLKRPAGK